MANVHHNPKYQYLALDMVWWILKRKLWKADEHAVRMAHDVRRGGCERKRKKDWAGVYFVKMDLRKNNEWVCLCTVQTLLLLSSEANSGPVVILPLAPTVHTHRKTAHSSAACVTGGSSPKHTQTYIHTHCTCTLFHPHKLVVYEYTQHIHCLYTHPTTFS